MKVQIFSDEGQPIETSGDPGELVCTAPFPSQPAFFWGDKDGRRYQSAYFEKFPGMSPSRAREPGRKYCRSNICSGVWHQGDYVRMDPVTQGIQFLGRSDGVLNPSGS
jgi:acetoacetyl-CoA synthetase